MLKKGASDHSVYHRTATGPNEGSGLAAKAWPLPRSMRIALAKRCLAAEATGQRLSPAPDLAARLPQLQRARAPAADHALRIRIAGGVEFLEQAEIALAVVGEEAVSEHAGLSTM